eukprot:CAMPEP_0201604166 /NCGR_PEP_ID=MMETSP0492-20130828/4389_1 /ASSEMBLY_ACC=CAM_ASM_000837 /TAXON_ID=420259 /ORGANISM="Thalassiosira gravida, Strain GMp14c1" /LENGTH=313 /DNA_ID=CAMNT_0048068131 /DNA_START=102 /DNA_END=1043 /DNA_ORIENTATION=-
MKYQPLPRRSSTTAHALASTLLLLTSQTQIQYSYGFSTTTRAAIILNPRTHHCRQSLIPLNSEVHTSFFVDSAEDENDDASTTNANANEKLPQLEGSLKSSFLLEFELVEHKPLGCSVEESLANEEDGSKYVFVAEVNNGGNAAKAGLKKGDVIVQLSGTFSEVTDVTGLGIEKIRSLVGGRPDENPLIMCIARGSDVMERHELALVELCIVGDDATTADCIDTIYSADASDYYLDGQDTDVGAICDEDDGTECMLDSMWSDWSFEEEKEEETKVEEVEEKPKKVAQPWASRSSGSGTYVRDPKTGKMRNIDE